MAETKILNLASFEDVETLKQTTKSQGEEISQVKGDLEELNTLYYPSKSYDWDYVGGYYRALNVGDTVIQYALTGYRGKSAKVKKGDTFTFGGIGNGNCYSWLIADSNNKMVSKSDVANSYKDPVKMQISQDGYIYVNWHDGTSTDFDKCILKREESGLFFSVKEDVEKNKTDIAKIKENGVKSVFYDFDLIGNYYRGLTVGSKVVVNPYPDANFVGAKIRVYSGDRFKVRTLGNGNCRNWIVTDTDNVILSLAQQNADNIVTPKIIEITQNGYLYVNCYILDVADVYDIDLLPEKIGNVLVKNIVQINGNSAWSINSPFGSAYNKYYYKAFSKSKTKTLLPLLIICGQSNSDGRAPEDTMPSGILNDSKELPGFKMWNWYTKGFHNYALEKNVGANNIKGYVNNRYCFAYDVFFANKYIQDNGELYAIKISKGATGIYNGEWSPDGDCGNLANKLVENINEINEWAEKNNVEFYPLCVLYHQGEWDADTGHITEYKDSLTKLLSFIRGSICSSRIPVINGECSYIYANGLYTGINDVFAQIGLEDDCFKTVNMAEHQTFISSSIDGLGNLHYDASALQYMGEQMYEIFKSMTY